MSKPLFEASDESEQEAALQLGTNKEYANAYNNFRKKELLKKFKDRGYNDIDSDDSSDDSETSDEDDEQIDETFDREFFKTLASLKSKDPAIYDKKTQFFTSEAAEDEAATAKITKKSSKPVTLKDYERKVIVEHGGRFEDEADSDADADAPHNKRAASPTVVEEEQRLKAEFKQALEADDSADEEFGGIFKKRMKSKEEKTQEETDFAEWLAGKQADIEASAKQKLQPLKNYWNQRNLPQSERFLRDYILNKGYANTKSADIPSYAEIVGDDVDDDDDEVVDKIEFVAKALADDERELEKQAEFEEKYNFRYEEPDAEFIKRFPRTIEHSVRQDAGKRKEKRQELKQRKQAEKEQKMQELEILKEMKRKEILNKIEMLKKVTGNEELGFNDDELEEDFDPEAHDRRMREIFNEDYYQVDEGEEKPECPSDIDELKIEDWDNYDPQRMANGDDGDYAGVAHCEDDDFNMDCDYDPAAAKQQLQQELIDNTKKRKNRRGRRNRFMEMIQQEKPAFDPADEKTYAEYIDEYYKMDCEDIIGDVPCRFKYVETTPNDFGLTVEEILLAKNKELNQWASLKKALQIRPEQVEKRDQRLYKMKAKNEALKRKIFKSLYGEGSGDEDDEQQTKAADNENEQKQTETVEENKTENKKTKKKKRKNKPSNEATAANELSKKETPTKVEPAKAKTLENGQATETKALLETTSNEATTTTTATTENAQQTKKKKKRKNKQKQAAASSNATEAATPEQPPAAKKPKLSLENSEAVNATTTAAIATPASVKKQKKKPKKQLQQQQSAQAPSTNESVSKDTATATATNSPTTKTLNPFTTTKPTAKATNKTHQQNGGNPFKAARNPDQVKFANDKASPATSGKRQFGKSKFDSKSKTNFKAKSKPNFNKNKQQLSKKPFGRRNPHAANSNGQAPINDERLKAYNINPRKFHKKQKFGSGASGGGGGGRSAKQNQARS